RSSDLTQQHFNICRMRLYLNIEYKSRRIDDLKYLANFNSPLTSKVCNETRSLKFSGKDALEFVVSIVICSNLFESNINCIKFVNDIAKPVPEG
ncbi:hypothetical protein ACPB30_01935, partial [Escherichia coli]